MKNKKSYSVHERVIKHKGFSTFEIVDVSYDKIHEAGQIRKRFDLFTSGDSVAALIYHTDEACFYFVKQFRCALINKHDPWLLELVAGGIDDNESEESAIKREVLEEIGHELSHIEKISAFYVTPGRSSEFQHVYYSEISNASKKSDSLGLEEEQEDLEIIKVPLSEIKTFLPEIIDVKTILAVQWFIINKLS